MDITIILRQPFPLKTYKFGFPLPVETANIQIEILNVSGVSPGVHEVFTHYNFTYDRGSRGIPTDFRLWLDSVEATVNERGVENSNKSGIVYRQIQTEADVFCLYFQVIL
jgi:hypothetical protein